MVKAEKRGGVEARQPDEDEETYSDQEDGVEIMSLSKDAEDEDEEAFAGTSSSSSSTIADASIHLTALSSRSFTESIHTGHRIHLLTFDVLR